MTPRFQSLVSMPSVHGLVVIAMLVAAVIVTPEATASSSGKRAPSRAVFRSSFRATSARPKKKRTRFPGYFNFATVGDGCGSGDVDTPNMRPLGNVGPNATAEIGDTRFAWCFFGFDPRKPISVQFTRPDGRVLSYVAPQWAPPKQIPPGALHDDTISLVLRWPVFPGTPMGRYAVVARQGARVAYGSLLVNPAKRPTVGVAPLTLRIGHRFDLVLAGFPANRRVRIAIYRDSGKDRCPGQRLPPSPLLDDVACLTHESVLVKVNSLGEIVKRLDARPPVWRKGVDYILGAAVAGRYVTRSPFFSFA